jgi:hypothetical protein
MRALAILTVLPLVVTTPALSQNAQSTQQQSTSPNSWAGIPGQPGSKSGPAVKPPSATTGSGVDSDQGRNQDATKVPGLPGSKSGPTVKPPSSSAPAPK